MPRPRRRSSDTSDLLLGGCHARFRRRRGPSCSIIHVGGAGSSQSLPSSKPKWQRPSEERDRSVQTSVPSAAMSKRVL